MMMNRAHFEATFVKRFIRKDLQNNRKRFRDKNQPDEDERERLVRHQSDATDPAADGERSGVAHENCCRVSVEPQEGDACAENRQTQNTQFFNAVQIGQMQVTRQVYMTRHIGKNRVGEQNGQGTTDGQTVQSVRQIKRIACPRNHEKPENCQNDERYVCPERIF